MYTEFWSENLKGRHHLEKLLIDGSILGWIFEKWGGRVLAGFI
jgi:hypothetical protein